jgi:hypothetical protein
VSDTEKISNKVDAMMSLASKGEERRILRRERSGKFPEFVFVVFGLASAVTCRHRSTP